MNTFMLMIPIVFIVVLLILFVVFLMISSRQEKVLKTIDKDGKVKAEEYMKKENTAKTKNTKTTNTVTTDKKEQFKKEDVFKFMEFDRIMDKMIVQNGGSRFTMAIRCKGINYDLMSEMEQLSVEEGFITFLNTLKYPIQLYVQAQNIDLKGNISKYKTNIEGLTEDYKNINEDYNKIASAFDADERELDRVGKEREKITNVYEYAQDIIRYVEKMSTNKNLLQRKFYILLSYNTAEINSADKFNKDELIEMCSTELLTRCNGIISALSSCSVSGEILDSNELADLLYSAYNRDDKSLMSVKEAVDSGMLRLYSTSQDAFEKEQDKLEEYIKNQARLKAYKAILYAKEHDEISTPASEVLAQEEEISRMATNYIKNSDYSPEEKDIATKKVLADYREDKRELTDMHEVQKQEYINQMNEDAKKIPELENMEVPHGIQLIEKANSYEDMNNEVQVEKAVSNNEQEISKVESNQNETENNVIEPQVQQLQKQTNETVQTNMNVTEEANKAINNNVYTGYSNNTLNNETATEETNDNESSNEPNNQQTTDLYDDDETII